MNGAYSRPLGIPTSLPDFIRHPNLGPVLMPLPVGTALCFACRWMVADWECTQLAADHTRKTRHPVIANSGGAGRDLPVPVVPAVPETPSDCAHSDDPGDTQRSRCS
jgi:hypothetical protein